MDEWREVLLEDLAATSKNALVGGPFGSDLVSKDYVSVGVAVIRGVNLANGRWVSGEFARVNDDKARKLAANTAKPYDIIFTQRGANHYKQVSIVPAFGESLYIISQSQMKMTVNEYLADPLFIYYLFQDQKQRDYLENNAISTGVPHTNLGILRSVPLRVPSLGTQKRIASILGALDDKIELNQRMNETLEAMARATFRDWFVDFGPIRAKMEGRALYLAPESWLLFPDTLGEDGKPAGWHTRPLNDFFVVVGGGTPKTSVPEYWGGEIPWFSVVDTPPAGSIYVVETEKNITERGLAESSARLIPAGTTIISARGTVGNLAMAAVDMTFNQSCYALKRTGQTGDCFVYLAAQHMVTHLQAMAHGSVFSTITRQTFDAISLAMPPPEVLAAFERQVSPFLARIRANVIESRTLSQLRDLLLPKLMSGEIRLRDAERAVEAVA